MGSFVLEQMEKIEFQFANRTLPELIFAGIKPDNRLDEYTPWPAPSLSPAFHDFGGKGSLFLEDLTNTIIPTVEDMHHMSPDPETRGLIGASLGGLFSMYAMLQKPEIFGRIGCISGSFWYENRQTMSAPHLCSRHASASICLSAEVKLSIKQHPKHYGQTK